MSAVPLPQPKRELDPLLVQPPGEAERMEAIGRLVSGVAHDFNNLLTGIVLCADLMLAGLEKESRLRRYAQEIRAAGAQGAGLIQQLLAVARQRAVETRVLSFNEAIGGLHGLLARLIGENIELVTDSANDLKLVRMDPAEVQQIILNLVLNARDAMPDGGRVTLRTRNCNSGPERLPPQAAVEFTVQDTGCGMDEATRSRVFETFFTTKIAGHGNGLGLSTVYAIVKRAGGTVEIESQPGAGTRVLVRLPTALMEPARLSPQEVSHATGPGRKREAEQVREEQL